MGNSTFLAWLTAGRHITAWNTPVTCHSGTRHLNDVFFLSSSFFSGGSGGIDTERSEGNLGTTKIALRGLALRMLEKQTDCWLGCGQETPNFRRQAGQAQLSWSSPQGTCSGPGERPITFFRSSLSSTAPLQLRKAAFSLDSCHPAPQHPLQAKVAPAFQSPHQVPNVKFINHQSQETEEVT